MLSQMDITYMGLVYVFAIASTFAYFEYYYVIRTCEKSWKTCTLYLALDWLHCLLYVFLTYLALNLSGNLARCVLMNMLYLVIITFFFFHKRCLLTTWAEQLMELEEPQAWINPTQRIINVITGEYKSPGEGNTLDWINGNRPVILGILASNLYCLWKWWTEQQVLLIAADIERENMRDRFIQKNISL
jgi:hypothetical protein